MPEPPGATPESGGRHIVRGALLSGAGMACAMAAMLLAGKMVTNALPQEIVTVFVLLLLCADCINTSTNFGLAMALPKLISAAPEHERQAVAGSALRFQTAVSVGAAALLIAIWAVHPAAPAWISDPKWRAVYPYLWLLPPLFIVGTIRDTLFAVLAGLQCYGNRAAAQMLNAFAQVLLIFIFIWQLRGGIAVLGLMTAAAHALAVALMLAAMPRAARWAAAPALRNESLRFARPLYANAMLHFLYQRFDTVLIAMLIPAASTVAIYELAKRIPLLFSRSLGALLVPFLPTVARHIADGNLKEAGVFLHRAYALTAFAGYTGALAIVLIQEPLIIFLFNAEYLEGARVLGLLTIAACLTVQAGIMGQTLIALGKPAWVIYVNIVMALVSVGANFALIPLLGLPGAALAAVLAAFTSNAAQSYCVHRQGIPVSSVEYIKPHLLLALAVAAIFLGGGGYGARFIALGIFVAGALATRMVTPREFWMLARKLLPHRGAPES